MPITAGEMWWTKSVSHSATATPSSSAALFLERRPRAHLLELVEEIVAAALEAHRLRRIQPERQPPCGQHGEDAARQEGDEPRLHSTSTPPTFSISPARGDRAGAGDDHLVEDVGGVGQHRNMPRATLLPVWARNASIEAERDRRHDDEARDPGRHDEGQQEIGDDEPEQDPRIGGADPQHHHVGEPARDAGARRDHAEQQRREQEPGGVVGEAGERDVESARPRAPRTGSSR